MGVSSPCTSCSSRTIPGPAFRGTDAELGGGLFVDGDLVVMLSASRGRARLVVGLVRAVATAREDRRRATPEAMCRYDLFMAVSR